MFYGSFYFGWQVYIYNGVLSGPSVVQRVELWPLAPVPEVPMPMNTSLMAAVTLQNSSFDPIQQLAILVRKTSQKVLFLTVSFWNW